MKTSDLVWLVAVVVVVAVGAAWMRTGDEERVVVEKPACAERAGQVDWKKAFRVDGVGVGMTLEQVRAVWGKPEAVDQHVWKFGYREVSVHRSRVIAVRGDRLEQGGRVVVGPRDEIGGVKDVLGSGGEGVFTILGYAYTWKKPQQVTVWTDYGSCTYTVEVALPNYENLLRN